MDSISNKLYNDTAYVQRLTDAGIQAFTFETYQSTWLAVISSRVLQKASAAPKSVFMAVIKDKASMDQFIQNGSTFPIDSYGNIPELSPLQRKLLTASPLNFEELEQMKLLSKPTPPQGLQLGVPVSFYSYASRLGKEVIRTIQVNFDYQSLQKALQFFRDPMVGANAAYSIQGPLIKMAESLTPTYVEVLDYFDIGMISRGSSSPKMMPSIHAYLKKVKERKAAYDFAQIETIEKFIEMAQKVLGLKNLRLRDQSVGYTYPLPVTNINSFPTYSMIGIPANGLVAVKAVDPATTQFRIEYTNLDILRYYGENFSPSFQAEIKAHYQAGPVDPNSEASRFLLRKGLQEFGDHILSSISVNMSYSASLTHPNVAAGYSYVATPYMYSVEHRMTAATALRLFNQSNPQVKKLLRDVVKARMPKLNSYQAQTPITTGYLPFSELETITMGVMNSEINAIGSLLRMWVASAKDDAEFVQRCQQATALFMETYPELKLIFPKY